MAILWSANHGVEPKAQGGSGSEQNHLGASRRQLVVAVVDRATTSERDALLAWARKLLEIGASSESAFSKAKQAVLLTAASAVIWPTVKTLALELKHLGWDDQALTGRTTVGGAATAFLTIGSKGARIAALGTAVGVPLWVVLAGGSGLAGHLIETIIKRKS
jgi:hypothetical protein